VPTFKHPCPYCGKFIDRAVAACPYCSQPDPFAPKRCPNCRKIVDDPAWVTCPSCGQSLVAPPPDAATAAAPMPERPPLYKDPDAPEAPPAAAGKCSGCGAPLAAGARFCTVCGTMAS
jgi:predicted amidophosphoribosyltransferase